MATSPRDVHIDEAEDCVYDSEAERAEARGRAAQEEEDAMVPTDTQPHSPGSRPAYSNFKNTPKPPEGTMPSSPHAAAALPHPMSSAEPPANPDGTGAFASDVGSDAGPPPSGTMPGSPRDGASAFRSSNASGSKSGDIPDVSMYLASADKQAKSCCVLC
mmetsp:Transcript_53955/g.99685  ORF Transcript_53955/g.99685 Transcript_53955/m.99685 type:complete len:160 (-) Transcript_53955:55-534(-)